MKDLYKDIKNLPDWLVQLVAVISLALFLWTNPEPVQAISVLVLAGSWWILGKKGLD